MCGPPGYKDNPFLLRHPPRSNRNKGGKASVQIKLPKYLIFIDKSPTFLMKWVIFFVEMDLAYYL